MNKGAISKTQIYATISLLIMIVAIPFLIALLRYSLDVGSNADESVLPQELVVSNTSDTSVTITWITEVETKGYIMYGTSESTFNLIASDVRDAGNDALTDYRQHIVNIRNLSPDTKYFFAVNSDGNEVEPVQTFSTDSIQEDVALPQTLKGRLDVESPYMLVYYFAGNNRSVSETRSTYTANNGTFTYDVSGLQTEDGSSEFPLDGAKIVTYVNGLDNGRARKFHDPDEDPGELVLNTDLDISFDKSVSIPIDEETTTPVAEPSTEEPTPTPSTPTAEPEDAGISLMNTLYSNTESNSDTTIPTNIFVSNITEVGFSVNWHTKEPTSGYLLYGKSSLNKKALDVRDSQPDVKRFTHSVAVSDASLTSGDSIYFKIVSDGEVYGLNGGSSSYEFVAPDTLSSPPSPEAVVGKLDYLNGSLLSSSKRDFIIYAKTSDVDGNASTYISTVPAFNSNGWTLSTGNARLSDLSDNIDSVSMSIYVVGEYNSVASASADITEEMVTIEVEPGLSITNINHGESYPSLSEISGTGKANSNVSLTFGSASLSAQADSSGKWSATPGNLLQGTYNLEATSEGQVLGLDFGISLGELPVTSIGRETIFYIIGIILLFTGVSLSIWAKIDNKKSL